MNEYTKSATLGRMKSIDADIIDKIVVLSKRLPEKERRQLFELLSSWGAKVRHSPRETYTERLKFTSKNATNYGYAKDVSTTGILIKTSAIVELGESITLDMLFISARNLVRLHGTVVRKTNEDIGIHFDETSSAQMKALDTIISQHVSILSPTPTGHL